MADYHSVSFNMRNQTIYTIGHSLTQIDEFIKTLRNNEIEVLVDVRTYPKSNRARQFNQESISESLSKNKIQYLYRGNNLGGLGENIDFDDTIFEISQMAINTRTVLMCSEGNPKKCHRYSILTPAFEKQGLIVVHLVSMTNKPQISQF